MADGPRGAVEARENPEFDFGEADLGRGIAGGDAVVAGEDQFEAAANADAVHGSDDGHGQLLDTIEQGIDHAHFGDDFGF